MAFSYYKKISFNGALIGGSFQNFCLFFDFTDTQIRDACRADGYDIKFYSTSGQTGELPYYRTYWDASAGRWVGRVLLTLTPSTEIFLFYGDSGISSDPSNKRATFDPAGVVYYFTFDDDPGDPNSPERDLARLTNHAGGETTANQLTIGGNDVIHVAPDNKVGPNSWNVVVPPQAQFVDAEPNAGVPNWNGGAWGFGPLWIHAWQNKPQSQTYFPEMTGNSSFIVLGNGSGSPFFKLKIERPYRFQLQSSGFSEGGVGSFTLQYPFDIQHDTWFCHDFRFDRVTNTMQVYVDSQPGEEKSRVEWATTDFTGGLTDDGIYSTSILNDAGYGSNFTGHCAELIISHFSPTDERIETAYNSELDHTAFRTFGQQELVGPPPVSADASTPLINGGFINGGLIKA